MARSTRRPRVGTLADVIRQGSQLWLFCSNPNCLHNARLDPLALAITHGEDLKLQRLLELARCTVCDGYDVELQVPPDVGPGGLLRRRDDQP